MLPSNSVNCERFAFGVLVILGSLCISNPPFHALLDRAGLEEEEEQVVAGTCAHVHLPTLHFGANFEI